MGIPSVITTDQGTEFRNKLNDELTSILGIKHRLTTAYHPQANGLDERYNQTLTHMIIKFVGGKKDEWDVKLPELVYAYNTAVQESSKFTPFEVMFGRMAKLPIDFNALELYDVQEKLQEFQDDDESFENMLTTLDKKRSEMNELVKENIVSAQKKQKEYYDKKHGAGALFTRGALVLKKDFRRKKRRGGKIDYIWEGPFVINNVLGRGLYSLKKQNGKQVI